MRILRIFLATMGRFCMSAIFLAGAVKNILHWQETEKDLMTILSEWQNELGMLRELQDFFSFIIPWSPLLLVVATLLMLVGGLFVLLGIKERFGAFLLFVFLVPTTVLYHPFWFVDSAARDLQTIMFLKNLALIGCLLLMMLHGGQAKFRGESVPSLKI